MDVSEIKNELENIGEIPLLVEEFEKSSYLHDREFLMKISNDTPIKIKLINSALKEKQEINDRLCGLLYHLGLLRSTVLIGDKKSTDSLIEQFLRNEYSGVYAVIEELNEFKMMIEEAEKHYKKLAESSEKKLENRLDKHNQHEEYIKKLAGLHKKQKEIFVGMNQIFFKLTKKAFLDGTLNKPAC